MLPFLSWGQFSKFSVSINSLAAGNCAADALTMQSEVFQVFLDAVGLQGQLDFHICTSRIMVNKDIAEGNRKNISCLASLTHYISAIKKYQVKFWSRAPHSAPQEGVSSPF